MKVRAVILDVYHTLLRVAPPPPDAQQQWALLWKESFGKGDLLSLEEISDRCLHIIQREHAVARGIGVRHPEILWEDVMREALPELERLDGAVLEELLFRHTQLQRTVTLMPGAPEVLTALSERGVILGIASNSQAYTLRELDLALASAKLDRTLFRPELCFWSYQFGFSKPDAHVYRILDARIRHLGVASNEILMAGDRIDNDTAPAQRQGWHTWRMTGADPGDGETSGNWEQLGKKLGLAKDASSVTRNS